jgi:CheY-like chemotaxis protein
MADLLLESSLTPEQKEYVQSTRLCAENLLESLSTALEYAAVSAGHLKLSESAFHLNEVIRPSSGAMEMRAQFRGITLRVFYELAEGAAEVVIGDAVRLRQVLTILLSHALKNCLQDEVPVAVSTYNTETSRELILTVSVVENGPEVSEERLARLFQPPELGGYSQASLELGVPLANQLVTAMGGILGAESSVGCGTIFTLTLPLRLPDITPETGHRNGAGGTRPTILLVEDNEVAQRFMCTVLERKGYEVHVASSGEDAVAAVGDCIFDLILMDVQMPGMDGMEATRMIRRMRDGKNAPIVACTANNSPEVRNLCIASGMDDFLSKPVHTAELVEIVGKYLSARR